MQAQPETSQSPTSPPTSQPFHLAFDKGRCRELIGAVLAALGHRGDWGGNRLKEPARTLRVVAWKVALEQDFDHRTINEVSGCGRDAVRQSVGVLMQRIARQEKGVRGKKNGSNHPLAPTLERAREAAAAWAKNGNNWSGKEAA